MQWQPDLGQKYKKNQDFKYFEGWMKVEDWQKN